jgi:hypothetical protein
MSDTAKTPDEAGEPTPPETALPPAASPSHRTPSSKHSNTVAILVAVVAVLVIGLSALLVWQWFGARQPAASTSPGVETTGGDPAVASAQAKAVGEFLGAWVADDKGAIEKLVTARSLPWTVAPPPLPDNIPRALVSAVAKPRIEGDTWVIGDQSTVFVRLNGDGVSPKGLVVAQLVVSNGAPRRVEVGVVEEGGAWKVDTVNGLPAAQGLGALLR